MKYTGIAAATDWFFVHTTPSGKEVKPVAAFALTTDGEVVGLVSAPGRPAQLVPVPTSGASATYLERSQLTDQERALLASSRMS